MTVANKTWTEIASHIYRTILQVSRENYSSNENHFCKVTVQSQSMTPYSECENTSRGEKEFNGKGVNVIQGAQTLLSELWKDLKHALEGEKTMTMRFIHL